MTVSGKSSFLTNVTPTCPDWLLTQARQNAAGDFNVAIVGANSAVAMETAMIASQEGIATPHLIGAKDIINHLAQELNWDISEILITDANDEEAIVKAAIDLVHQGMVQAVMKGHVHTDRFMSGMLKRDNGIRGDKRMVHIFAMFPADGGKPLLISDAAVNVEPDMKTRQTMMTELIHVAQALGIARPAIAVISATETPIASVPSSLAAKELADWGKANLTQADISGPLSFDLAISPEAVAIKGLDHDPVAGHADALIMPELTSGNVIFKSLVWFKGACAAGVVTGGKVPIMLTSRADPPAARIASVALAAQIYSN
ncbi:MAG: phosphate acetyltransferase [Alphaproteobacteria bacterium]|nr:phosphate acetyltransferase [Alphaproteobacteria bacterium]